jgi:hypothetical protein
VLPEPHSHASEPQRNAPRWRTFPDGHEFRFGLSASTFASVDALEETAVEAEEARFDSVTIPDLPGALSPLIALAAARVTFEASSAAGRHSLAYPYPSRSRSPDR